MSTPTKQPLHILQLRITNYGIIRAAAILPDGSPVILAGDNGQGKSTVLSAIESVLFAKKLAAPVTTGEDKSKLELELGEAGSTKPLYKIEQIIKNDDKGKPQYNLKIIGADGKQIPSPVQFIESLMQSGAALDPTAMLQAKPGERPETLAKRQAEELMSRLGLTAKAEALDKQINDLSTARKLSNDTVDSLKARLAALEVPKGTPDEPLDISALAKEQSDLSGLLAQRQRLADKIGPKKESEANAKKRVEELKRLLAEAEETLKGASRIVKDAEHELSEFDESNPPDAISAELDQVKEKLNNANAINAAVSQKQQRKQVSDELTQAEAKAGTLTKELETARDSRLNLVRSAKLPLEGLELTAEALLYKGKPLVQESTGNQIRICAQLAMAENPECRVLFIREGSLTNTANRKIIYDIADERGWQVWEEHFSESPMKDALWVEGGEVKDAPAAPANGGTKGRKK